LSFDIFENECRVTWAVD